MAVTTKRRWYQFSLKALLVLMAAASLPLGGYVARRQYLVAKRMAVIEGAFQWLESLEYPDVPNARLVLVTRKHRSNRETPFPYRPGFGFLLSEDAASFTILTLSLERKTFEREQRHDF